MWPKNMGYVTCIVRVVMIYVFSGSGNENDENSHQQIPGGLSCHGFLAETVHLKKHTGKNAENK